MDGWLSTSLPAATAKDQSTKYTLEIDIALPRDRVIELFDNPDNMPKWQPELLEFTPTNGTPGQVGAKSNLRYQMGKREVEMTETVTRRELPDVFAGTYEAKGVWNEVINRFQEVSPDETKWIIETEFRCTGFMKLIAFLMPGSFKKQSFKCMKRFKSFAENASSQSCG